MDLRGALRAGAIGALAMAALVGCSSDDEASTCDDLQNLADEVRGLQNVDLVGTGLSGLEDQVDAIEQAWEEAKESGEEQFGSQLDALEKSIDALGSTLSGASDGGSSISDVAGQVGSDIEAIADSWSDLTSAVNDELGDCDLGSSGG